MDQLPIMTQKTQRLKIEERTQSQKKENLLFRIESLGNKLDLFNTIQESFYGISFDGTLPFFSTSIMENKKIYITGGYDKYSLNSTN